MKVNLKIMNLKITVTALLYVFTSQQLSAQSNIEAATQILEEKYKVNSAFMPGEKLTYEIKYGIIKGGKVELFVGFEPVGYDYMFHVRAVAQEGGAVSAFATIYDIYESWFDIYTGLPVKAVRNVTENSYKRYNEDLFCNDSCVVYSMKSGRHEVPKNTFDLLSAFYYSRRFLINGNMKKNETMNLFTWFNEKLYPVQLRYKKTEKISTDFGKIECLKFVPVTQGNTMFKDEDAIEAWFTNDNRYVPVYVKIDMPFADLRVRLTNYQNLKEVDNPLLK